MNEKPLEKELQNVLNEICNNNILSAKIMKVWDNIAEDFARHGKPSLLQKKTLYIEAEDSDWMYICSLNVEKIRNKLAEFFEQKIIEDIKFKVGR
jgi:predicted nucleic acid-binding Zn ribbon protein